jgi:hypothetical protein
MNNTANKNSDKAATISVASYFERYVGIRGCLPRVVVAMMPGAYGWPVRNADGGADIAHFSTCEAAEKAVRSAERAAVRAA